LDSRRVIVALDYPGAEAALAMAARLDPRACRVKVGKELFVSAGPALLEDLHAKGHEVFLDLKFHDIPNTVAGACRAAARMGVWMVNVHASGGEGMLCAAREAVAGSSRPPLLIGVTVLTSLSDHDLARVGFSGGVEAGVAAGPAGDDQARIATPAEAVRLGSDYLVIGRPITGSPDPAAVLHTINQSLQEISAA